MGNKDTLFRFEIASESAMGGRDYQISVSDPSVFLINDNILDSSERTEFAISNGIGEYLRKRAAGDRSKNAPSHSFSEVIYDKGGGKADEKFEIDISGSNAKLETQEDGS